MIGGRGHPGGMEMEWESICMYVVSLDELTDWFLAMRVLSNSTTFTVIMLHPRDLDILTVVFITMLC